MVPPPMPPRWVPTLPPLDEPVAKKLSLIALVLLSNSLRVPLTLLSSSNNEAMDYLLATVGPTQDRETLLVVRKQEEKKKTKPRLLLRRKTKRSSKHRHCLFQLSLFQTFVLCAKRIDPSNFTTLSCCPS